MRLKEREIERQNFMRMEETICGAYEREREMF